MNLGANETPLNGVRCDVANCHYNKAGGQCTAKQVKVGPQFANSSSDTVCDTFKPANSRNNPLY
jgi:hypothetical protein